MPGRTTPASSRSTRSSRAAAPTPRRRRSGRNWTVNGEIVRIILGTVMLILGVMLLIGLFVPSGGQLTDFIRNIVAPWFGTPRWLLPFVLLLLGYYLYRAQSDNSDWQLTLLGSAVSYLALLGVVGLVTANDARPRGGGIGKALADFLPPLISAPGAGLILVILTVAGLLLALDMSLPAVMAPIGRLVSRAINALFRPAPAEVGDGTPTAALSSPASPWSASAAGNGATARSEKRGKEGARSAVEPGASFGEGISTIPVAIPNPGPLSQTFAPPASASRGAGEGDSRDGQSIRNGAPVRGQRQPTDAPAQSKLSGLLATTEKPRPEYHLPPRALLEDIAPHSGDSTMDHRRNAAIIVAKLASFNIPARVAVWNAGPVVTQYEVEPSPEIKVSRIEALSDDLAMALAAPTIRIEAPIPGKSVVGLEIPNKDPNIVQLRRILDEVDLRSASKLTFALGRDVAGHARATDLARMPHLLIAGATGSGKSVMVNALITSLLCNSTPDEVRLVLMDLKRVELSAYNGLPHLMIPVIIEPERAKAALKWAVSEMENRFRRFAGANAKHCRVQRDTGRSGRPDVIPGDHHRRAGRPDDARGQERRRADRPTGPEGKGNWHPPRAGHAAALGKRRHRTDQGQLPEPHRVRHGLANRLAHDSRHAGRGGPDRPRRHALPAGRRAPPDPPSGCLRVRQGDREHLRALAGRGGAPLRHVHRRHRRGA